MEMARNVIASRYANMSDAEFNAAVRDVTRTAKNDAEAAKARDRMIRLRKMGQGEAPSRQENIRRGMDSPLKKARGGKIKGYRYGTPKGGVKACRGRKANYKA